MQPKKKKQQVVIVGGGPVGMAMAIELAQRGITSAIVERRTQGHRIPKGQGLQQRTMEHFYSWGLLEKVRAARVLPPDFSLSGVTAYMNLSSEYWYSPPFREVVNQYYFQNSERVPQYLTEGVLRERMTELPGIESWTGWTVEPSSRMRTAFVSAWSRRTAPAKCSKRITPSVVMAVIRRCVNKSASHAAARTSISSWCSR